MDVMLVWALAGLIAITLMPLALTNWRIAWTLYLLCLACNGLSITLGPASFRIDLLALPLLIAVAVAGRSESRPRPRYVVVATGALTVWITVGMISSAINAPDPIPSFGVIAWISLGVLTLLVVLNAGTSAKELVRVGTVPLALLSALFAISWMLHQVAGLETPFVIAGDDGLSRIVGLAFEPNIFGALTTLWIALVVYWRKDLSRSTFLWSTLIGLASVLTMTRAAWVALVIVMLPVILSHVGKFLRAVLLVGVGVMAFPDAWALVGTPFVERLSRLGDLESGTAAFRIGSWRMAMSDVEMSGNHAFGLGVNTFSQRHSLAVDAKQTDYLSNAWIAQLHDVGIVGTAALAIALFALWSSTARRRESLPFFIAFVLTSGLTSGLWFAFPWLMMGLFDYRRQEVEPDDLRVAPLASERRLHVHE